MADLRFNFDTEALRTRGDAILRQKSGGSTREWIERTLAEAEAYVDETGFGSEFVTSLREWYTKHGFLTPRQLSGLLNVIDAAEQQITEDDEQPLAFPGGAFDGYGVLD